MMGRTRAPIPLRTLRHLLRTGRLPPLDPRHDVGCEQRLAQAAIVRDVVEDQHGPMFRMASHKRMGLSSGRRAVYRGIGRTSTGDSSSLRSRWRGLSDRDGVEQLITMRGIRSTAFEANRR